MNENRNAIKCFFPIFSVVLLVMSGRVIADDKLMPQGNVLAQALSESVSLQLSLSDRVRDHIRLRSFQPFSFEWLMMYYYRSQDGKTRRQILDAFLLAKEQEAKQDGLDIYGIRFFSTLAGQDAAFFKELKDQETKVDYRQKKMIQAIIAEAASNMPRPVDSPEAMRLALTAFSACGDEQIIIDIADFLGSSQRELSTEDEVELVIRTLRDLRICRIFKKIISTTNDSFLQKKLTEITRIVDLLTSEAEGLKDRAYNLVRENDIRQGLSVYFQALALCPDYSVLFNNLSNVYESQKDDDKTVFYLRAAIYLEPGYASALYNLGRYYFIRQQYDQAVVYYQRAVAARPTAHNYHHALARAYQEKGDVPSAVIHFQEYLRQVPDGEHSGLVRAYLSSVNADLSADEQSNPVIMLRDRKFFALEKYLDRLLKSRERDKNGQSLLYNAYISIAEPKDFEYTAGDLLGKLQEWLTVVPDSHFANALLGSFYVNYAWLARGPGFSQAVTSQGSDLFQERLLQAENYLEKAYARDRSDPFVPAELMTVLRGINLPDEFRPEEFVRDMSAERLLGALQKDGLEIPSEGLVLDKLNMLLQDNALIEKIISHRQDLLPEDVAVFRAQLAGEDPAVGGYVLINRMFLQTFYPADCPLVGTLRMVLLDKQFQRAVKADPGEYMAYYPKLIFLAPKWHGSWETMFRFARESLAAAPQGTLVPKIILNAHWEKFNFEHNQDYFKEPGVWQEMKHAYLDLLKSFPESVERRNWFALSAYWAGDYEVVREQVKIIGDRWHEGGAWKDAQAFERVKQEMERHL